MKTGNLLNLKINAENKLKKMKQLIKTDVTLYINVKKKFRVNGDICCF